jgi:hypothetical protein
VISEKRHHGATGRDVGNETRSGGGKRHHRPSGEKGGNETRAER